MVIYDSQWIRALQRLVICVCVYNLLTEQCRAGWLQFSGLKECVRVERERERQRETETETDRDRETQRDRDRDRETERQTDRQRQTDR